MQSQVGLAFLGRPLLSGHDIADSGQQPEYRAPLCFEFVAAGAPPSVLESGDFEFASPFVVAGRNLFRPGRETRAFLSPPVLGVGALAQRQPPLIAFASPASRLPRTTETTGESHPQTTPVRRLVGWA